MFHFLWKSLQYFGSRLCTSPSVTKVLASSGVPISTRSSPLGLLSFRLLLFEATLRNFILPFSWGSWACSSAMAFCWFLKSILFVLTLCAITVNCRSSTFVRPTLPLVHPSSCSSRIFVSWLSVVTQISLLYNLCAASTLPAFLERAVFIDSMSLSLVWQGFGSSMTVTVTSFRALLSTGFSWTLWDRARWARSAYVDNWGSMAARAEGFYSMADSLFRMTSWAEVAVVFGVVLSSFSAFFR